jgi:hypothetical protein
MRLIDADALKIELSILHGGDYKTIHYLNHARTVDAVPVIRCKDCCYNSNREGNYVNCDIHPSMFGRTTDNYCSRAERKEHETD